MKKNIHRLLALALIAAFLALPSIAVLAKELGSLQITGPGIKGTLTINDPKEIMKLEDAGFFDPGQSASVMPPADLGTPYSITAHLNLDGKVVPFIQMDYYPVEGGKPGYVHYTGRMNGASMQKVDQWGMVRPRADNLFRELMAGAGVKIEPAVAAALEPAAPAEAAPAAAPSPKPPALQQIYLLLTTGILALAGLGLALRRRLASH